MKTPNCPHCYPPFPLRVSGWENPRWLCKRCSLYYDDELNDKKLPEFKDDQNTIILDDESEWYYSI